MIFNRPRRRKEKVSLTWYFNEKIDLSKLTERGFDIGFTSGWDYHYTVIYRGYNDTYGARTLIYKSNLTNYTSEAYRGGWRAQVYRTITFDEEPTGDFWVGWEANATPKEKSRPDGRHDTN